LKEFINACSIKTPHALYNETGVDKFGWEGCAFCVIRNLYYCIQVG